MNPIGSDPITVLVHIAPLRAAELASCGLDAAPTLLLALALVVAGCGTLAAGVACRAAAPVFAVTYAVSRDGSLTTSSR